MSLSELKSNDRIRQLTLLICIVCCLIMTSCGNPNYNSLTEKEKTIVDTVYANRAVWEKTTLEYANYTVHGEFVMRQVSFIEHDDALALLVILSLDQEGEELVEHYYSCDVPMRLLDKQYSRVVYSSGWGKSYYTTWSEQEKIDYLSKSMYNCIHK